MPTYNGSGNKAGQQMHPENLSLRSHCYVLKLRGWKRLSGGQWLLAGQLHVRVAAAHKQFTSSTCTAR
jgi:hypothetical protein